MGSFAWRRESKCRGAQDRGDACAVQRGRFHHLLISGTRNLHILHIKRRLADSIQHLRHLVFFNVDLDIVIHGGLKRDEAIAVGKARIAGDVAAVCRVLACVYVPAFKA